MTHGSARPATTDHERARRRGLFGSRLRDARIRSKLGLILIIPLIAVMVLGALRLVDSGQRALSAELVRSLAVVSAEASELAHQLHNERMEAARLLSDPSADSGQFTTATVATDDAVNRYQGARSRLDSVPDVVGDQLTSIDERLRTLDSVRQDTLGQSGLSAPAAALRYSVVMSDILAYHETVGQVAGDLALAESVRAVAALSKAKHQMTEAQAVAFLALSGGELTDQELTAFLATQTGQQEALLAFAQVATPEQQAQVANGLAGDAVVASERVTDAVVRSAGQDEPRTTAAAADRTLGAVVNLVQRSERRLHTAQVDLATTLRDDVFRQVIVESTAVLLVLAVAVAVAVLLARALARSLGQLRENALAVADRELPETVARLSDPRTLGENTPEQLAAGVREPIQMRSRDEIGQVAQAFNVVHRAAVRVAAEQAALRTSVSAMFLNLARRSQSLVDRMISQLDDIERHEEDPKRLARMFTLDHLATRMRRNDENLLVLAGADSSPPRGDDAQLADVLRAAQSEVEHYARIEFGTVDADVSVVAPAVNDVVRLVAELFDNATRFSPPESAVICEARRLGDQVIVQIEDRGVGMSREQVDQLNAWLASPPAVEVTTFRRMGLAVVARLAVRHQIRVELRCDPNYGTVSYVALPRPVLVLPRSRIRGAGQVPEPRAPLPVEQAPAAPPPGPLPSRHVGQLPRRTPAIAPPPAGPPAPAANDAAVAVPPAPPPERTLASGNGHADRRDAGHRDQPVAGRPPAPAAPPVYAPPTPEATVELPIFQEMEQVWFRSHGDLNLDRQREAPAAGSPPPAPTRPGYPDRTATPAPPAAAPAPPAAAPAPPVPSAAPAARSNEGDGTESWRTAADSGWQAAAAAAAPAAGGATASGLPRRVPQAQLVPGSVEAPVAATQRRSPEEIRGLLSAYHRGVQRGRDGGAR